MSDADGRLVYLPWPMVMDIADACDSNGYRQLAREARQAVWLEAERLFLRDRIGDAEASSMAAEQVGP